MIAAIKIGNIAHLDFLKATIGMVPQKPGGVLEQVLESNGPDRR
jgi:hypothetical protein